MAETAASPESCGSAGRMHFIFCDANLEGVCLNSVYHWGSLRPNSLPLFSVYCDFFDTDEQTKTLLCQSKNTQQVISYTTFYFQCSSQVHERCLIFCIQHGQKSETKCCGLKCSRPLVWSYLLIINRLLNVIPSDHTQRHFRSVILKAKFLPTLNLEHTAKKLSLYCTNVVLPICVSQGIAA